MGLWVRKVLWIDCCRGRGCRYPAAMVKYRRARVAGGTYFFTVTLRDRRANTLVTHIDALRNAMRHTRLLRTFTVNAIVILPEHLHTIWTLPEGDDDYSGHWRACKSLFVRQLTHITGNTTPKNIWQSRFWEHLIRDDTDFARHVDYTHCNPVKHGLVQHVADWPWSSFHQYVKRGLLPMDWGLVGEFEGYLVNSHN